ncbi:patatin-like phospholipase family protein [Devosia sp. CN2-171]|uniref:patatin-like phospholipase family protein n=1 Tax=Devosia sp. CN2-171 TaxID=3400909 RepID=UPI003BF7A94D
MPADYFRILSLDGGGAKGFYTLGVLRQIEAMIGCPIYERFDLIFGTSTGAIIAAMLGLGRPVPEIIDVYNKHVLKVVSAKEAKDKSIALDELAKKVFGDDKFDAVKTGVGIVTTRWATEKPMVFKGSVAQAHGSQSTFVPGFGVTIGDAVQASCSAYPFFEKKIVHTSLNEDVVLIDGGYCANNPTLYAIADAIGPLKIPREKIRIVSIGVGEYPPAKVLPWQKTWWYEKLLSVKLLQKTLEINTQSMDQLRRILFKDIETLRISKSFSHPDMATDLFEKDMQKLNTLLQRGRETFQENEDQLKAFLL